MARPRRPLLGIGHRKGGWFAHSRPHPRRDKPFAERLWDLIAGPWTPGVEWDDCWLFVGGWRSKHGYGRVKKDGRSVQAHVAAFEQVFGKLAPEHVARHACDIRLCCNPFHIAPGNHEENERDKYDKEFAWASTPLGEPPARERVAA